MTIQNPAQAAASPAGGERVQPDGPLSGEVQRGGILTPAVRRALAYAYATGFLPSHIHNRTYFDARDHLEGEVLKLRVKADVLPEVLRDPLAVACAYLTARGYVTEGYHPSARRRTCHYVAYRRLDNANEALAGRGGGVTLIQVNDCRPYRVSTNLTAKDVAAAASKDG